MTNTSIQKDIQVITFDCYGTLIDWEKGAIDIFKDILTRASSLLKPKRLFDRWEEIQFEYIRAPYEPYRDILYHSLLDTLDEFSIKCQDDDGDRFAHAIGRWQPFPEVPGALARLRKKFKLGIISNTDDDILDQSLHSLGVKMDYVITAESAGVYKPDPEPFHLAIERIGLPSSSILHAAFGVKYDLGPAARVGAKTAFINRSGIKLPPQFSPTLTVDSLNDLATALGA